MEDLPLIVRVIAKITDDEGFIAKRYLEDGRYVTLTPAIFTTRLTISRAGDEYGYYDAF